MIRKCLELCLILCWLWSASGCTSWLWTKKDNPSSGNKGSDVAGLIKPAPGEEFDQEPPDSAPQDSADAKNTSRHRDSSNDSETAHDPDPKMKDLNASEAVPRGRGPLAASSPDGKGNGSAERRKDKGSKDANQSPSSIKAFEKYDHSRYVKKIRAEAEKLVEKRPACFYARLCRDFILDEWTLDTFRKSKKTYSYVTYFWDAIDQQWEKTFQSNDYPLSDLKRFLKLSASGKECHVLKE